MAVTVTNTKTAFDADTNPDYAVDVGAGAVGSGTQRTTLASDDPAVASLASVDGKIIACDTGAVVVSSSALPTGAATAANQTTIIGHVDGIEILLNTIDTDTGNIATSIASVDGKITVVDTDNVTIAALPNEGQQTMANSISVAIASNQSAVPVSLTSTTITGTVAVTQSGTWDEVGINDSGNSITVDDGGTSLTVDGSVSISGTVAVTQSGTWDEVGINDSGNSITVDAPVGTPVFVRLSDGSSAITTLPVSLASVPSHAVTNAGTFVVQENGAALTALQLIDDVVYTDDTSTHSTGTSKGVGMMAVAVPTDTSVSANDIGMVGMTTDRRQYVEATIAAAQTLATVTTVGAVTSITNALPAGTNAIGKLAANSGVDIGDVDVTSLPKSSTATQTSVNDTNSSTTILASNASRLGASVMNDSSAVLYLRLSSSAASPTTYTVRVVQYGYYEVPFGYTGAITGIWASDPNDGGARVTEYT